MEKKDPKIALVHDYLPTYGGAEAVLAALHEAFPEAPIYTIFSNVQTDSGQGTADRDVLSEKFKDAKIITSWFNYLPFRERLMSPLLFLIPLIWASFDFSEYDLVISSASWAITKGFAGGKTKELCYCHTPPRYLYGYDTSGPWKKYKLVRIYAAICAHFMRLYDFKRAQKVTQFVANSREVAARIQKFYRRDSVVINPPVDLPPSHPGLSRISKTLLRDSGVAGAPQNGGYYLTGGRLYLFKNFDLIIKACNQLKLPLKIYGVGMDMENLKAIAGPTIEFLGAISEEEKYKLMANSKAFIVAAKDEDFGITPVEAMACGAPVVAYRGGGYLETVVGGKTGVFFDELTVEEVKKAIKRLSELRIKPEDCRKQAEKFSKESFIKKIKQLAAEVTV